MNAGTTEYMIAKKMAEKGVCARDTTHNVLHNDLIPTGKVLDRKKGNGFHKFYINYENEFNELSRKIDLLSEAIRSVNSSAYPELVNQDRLFRGMVELGQRVFYIKVTRLANNIRDYIKSTDDSELLLLRLVEVLEALFELNRKTSDSFFGDLETLVDELHILNKKLNKKPIRNKETLEMFRGVIKTITDSINSNLI